MSKEKDAGGDKNAKGKKSFVEQTSLINEIIKRENRFYSINKVFTLNPRKIIVTTEKPTSFKYNPSDYLTRSQQIPQNIFEKIQHHFRTPKDKFENPATSNHEIGWYFSDQLNRDTFTHKKGHCDVTKYANDYSAMTGRSPFSKKMAVVKKEEEKKSGQK